jgi:hypothetical protein
MRSILIVSWLAVSVAGCRTTSDAVDTAGSTTSGVVAESGPTGTTPPGVTTAARTAEIRGRLVNGTGPDSRGFGGATATPSIVSVAAQAILGDGATVTLATAPPGANGGFSIHLPAHDGPSIVSGLDASGNVVARAILEDPLVPGATALVQPLTTQSSVEAAVLLDMVASQETVSAVDLVGLRARIDAATAGVVQALACAAPGMEGEDIHALSLAARAEETSEEAFLDRTMVSPRAYTSAKMAAADALTAALYASSGTARDADADFRAQLAGMGETFGLDAASAAEGASGITSAGALAIEAASSSSDLIDAVEHRLGVLQSSASAAAMIEAFAAGGASLETVAKLQTVNIKLTKDLASASTATATSAAFGSWRASIMGAAAGEAVGRGGLLASVLGAAVSASPAYETTSASLTAASTALDEALRSSRAAAETAEDVDADKLAALVAAAYSTFDAAVTATVTSSTVPWNSSTGALVRAAFIASASSF